MHPDNTRDGFQLFGKYLGNFTSEPDNQVQSTVFERQGVIYVYYRLNTGLVINSITDKWLSEIIEYASSVQVQPKDIHLQSSQ